MRFYTHPEPRQPLTATRNCQQVLLCDIINLYASRNNNQNKAFSTIPAAGASYIMPIVHSMRSHGVTANSANLHL